MTNTFSFEDRRRYLKKIDSTLFDLVVVGGGINGAGVAREAALRGMKVALFEAQDFASGTSSKSSKLIHGGIRYLENLEFHLVFEALTERQKLFAMAPHLVHPLRFLIPLYKQGRVGMLKMGVGMWLYDALSMFQAPELYERLTVQESIDRIPFLQKNELLGSYVYSDAYMDDDRLVHETLRSAASAGSVCLNYAKACGVEFNAKGGLHTVEIQDQLSGLKKKVQARHIVSTTGPWTDDFAAKISKKWSPILRPTKGVHLTFEKNRFPISSAVVMAAEERIVFCIPRHEMVIVGTTDTDFSGAPESVSVSKSDVQYLLNVISKYFPGSKITTSDVIGSYAGVRPLVQDGSQSEGKTSREHTIFSLPEGVTFIAGGKYTTYRLIAEQVVEKCLSFFPIEDRVRFNRADSAAPLNPLIHENFHEMLNEIQNEILSKTHLSIREAQILSERHGAEALQMIHEFGNKCSYSEYETLHAIQYSLCLNLKDFFARRVPFSLSEKDHGLSKVDEVARVFQMCFSISDEEVSHQKNDFQNYLKNEYRWMNEH